MTREEGIWIPAELYLAKGLSMLEKVLFVEISDLEDDDGCCAGNKYFSDRLNVSTVRVSQIISKLKSLGLVEEVGFDGRVRVLRAHYENLGKVSTGDGL